MGRSCYVIKNKEGGIEQALAPNNQPSALYQRALDQLGDPGQAASVWGMAYSPEFVSFFGDWMTFPSEYDLDTNGEPLYEDVRAFIERKSYAVGEFMADEVKDIMNTLTATGMSDIVSLSDKIRSSFVFGGEVVLNRHNLQLSGMYTSEEIDNIISNPRLAGKVRLMMGKVLDFVSNGDMSNRESYFLSSDTEGIDPDFNVYTEGYDAMGKRRMMNPEEVRSNVMRAVGGITDRSAFDQAFRSLPYPSLVEAYVEDQGLADRMYERFGGLTRMEVRDINDNVLTDSSSNHMIYMTTPKNIKSLRDKIGRIVDMDDSMDAPSLKRELTSIALELADSGIDISDIVTDMMVVSRREDIRDIMASLDVMLSGIENGRTEYDQFFNTLDSMTGKGNNLTEVRDMVSDGNKMVYIRSGSIPPSTMMSRGLLYVGRNTFLRTGTPADTSEAYDVLAEIGVMEPTFLPKGIVPQGANSSSVGTVRSNLERYVRSRMTFTNTEDMILSALAYGKTGDKASEEIDMDRELNRYQERVSLESDILSSVMRLRSITIREKIKDSDLYNNVLRFLDFNGLRNVSLSHHDATTLKNIEMSLPDGEVRSVLYNIAMNSNDSTMDNLFYLDNPNKMRDSGFYRQLYLRHPGAVREFGGDTREERDGLTLAYGSYDNYISMGGGLYEKAGETQDGSVYRFVGDMIFSDPASYIENISPRPSEVVFSDNTTQDVTETVKPERISNSYTSGVGSLMREYACE